MIDNNQVRFKSRMYLNFNVSIKKIRLSNSLTKFMRRPISLLKSWRTLLRPVGRLSLP